MGTESAISQPRATTYRDYPEELKAAVISAIQANDGNVMATAKLFNIPQDTAYYWWRNAERFREIQRTSSLSLADKLESIAHANADSLAIHDLSAVAYIDKARALGVIIDKMQLLRGQPTSITANIETIGLASFLDSALADVIDVTPERE